MNNFNIDEMTYAQKCAMRWPRGYGEKPNPSLGWSHKDMIRGRQIGTFRTSLMIAHDKETSLPIWVATGLYLSRKGKSVRPRDRARQGMFNKTLYLLKGIGVGVGEPIKEVIDGGKLIQYRVPMTPAELKYLYQEHPHWKPAA